LLASHLVAQHLRHEVHQLANTADVRYLPRRNVLDPADDAAWQLGTPVQVEHEGAVGAQFEPGRFRGRGWRGSRNAPLPHAPDNTGRCSYARWNRREIRVRRWLKDGFRVMEGEPCLTFGGFSLDLAKEQLVCRGEVVALTPKAFAAPLAWWRKNSRAPAGPTRWCAHSAAKSRAGHRQIRREEFVAGGVVVRRSRAGAGHPLVCPIPPQGSGAPAQWGWTRAANRAGPIFSPRFPVFAVAGRPLPARSSAS
jgi:hypothetical protein